MVKARKSFKMALQRFALPDDLIKHGRVYRVDDTIKINKLTAGKA